MKNNILIILIIFCYLFFLNKTFGKEIEFDASDIEIINNQNLIDISRNQAKKANLFNKIVVSTDSKKIQKHVIIKKVLCKVPLFSIEFFILSTE